MKLALLYILLPFTVLGQSLSEGSNKVFNVYRRDSAVIYSYNLEFAKQMQKADSIKEGKTITAYLSKHYKGARCLKDVTLYFTLDFAAKDSRSKLKFDTVRYIAKDGDCRLNGTLTELLDCDGCKHYTRQLKFDYKQYVEVVYEAYKEFLIEKSKDENW